MEVHTSGDQEILNHLISELTSMTEHRRIRMLQSKKSLPGILWAVLIVGGIVTVGTSCFFGVDSLRFTRHPYGRANASSLPDVDCHR